MDKGVEQVGTFCGQGGGSLCGMDTLRSCALNPLTHCAVLHFYFSKIDSRLVSQSNMQPKVVYCSKFSL